MAHTFTEVGVCALNIQQLQQHTEVADYNTQRESNVTGLLTEQPSAFVLVTKLKTRKGAHSNKSPRFLLPTQTVEHRHSSPGPHWSLVLKEGTRGCSLTTQELKAISVSTRDEATSIYLYFYSISRTLRMSLELQKWNDAQSSI